MLIQIDADPVADSAFPLFRAGFRPFFLAAGVQAALMVPLWLAQVLSGVSLNLSYPSLLWHGHEMIFGFAGAAIAGFLLTAVPNWTGGGGLRGGRLAALAGLWLAARLAFAGAALVPTWIGAVLSLAFLPCLALALAPSLIKAGKWRNIAFVPILLLLTLANALVQSEILGLTQTGRLGLWGGVFIILTMIAIIGGRIIPGFTQSGLRMAGIMVQTSSKPWLDKTAIALLVAAGIAQLALPGSILAGGLCLLASIAHFARMKGWQGWRTGPVPLLWVLHLGYLWLPLGLGLLGLSSFVPVLTPQAAFHGLTVGCIGMMVLGVMSRAALGHSGRSLVPARPTVIAYGLIMAAAVLRVFGVLASMSAGLWLSGLLWSCGFALYVTVYAPICLSPRSDGRAG